MHLTTAQFETLYTLALAGMEAIEVTVHPYSGAATVTLARHNTGAIINPDGELALNRTGITTA